MSALHSIDMFNILVYGFVKVDHSSNVPFNADVFGWFGPLNKLQHDALNKHFLRIMD